jgi:hypothetical protein
MWTDNNDTNRNIEEHTITAKDEAVGGFVFGIETIETFETKQEREGRFGTRTLEIQEVESNSPIPRRRIRTKSCDSGISPLANMTTPNVIQGEKAMAHWSCKGKGLAVFTSGGDSQGS